MPRPLVAVYQEFATLDLPTPAAADLNTCVAAVAKQVVDYDDTTPSNTLVVDDSNKAVAFDAAGASANWNPTGLLPGATLESVNVLLRNPEVLVQNAAGVTLGEEDNELVFTTLDGTGGADAVEVAVGHEVYGRLDGASTRTRWGVIMAITPNEDDDTFTLSLNPGIPDDASLSGDSVIVTRTEVGEYDVRAGDVEFSPLDNTVQLLPTAAIKVGTADVNVTWADEVHVEYVARRSDLNYIQTITDTADAEAKVGKADPRNPLGLAVYLALLNAGTEILAYGVRDDTEAEYGLFQRVAMPRSDIYCVVPVCLDPEKQLAVVQSLKAKVAVVADAEEALKTGVPQRFKMVVAGGLPAVADPKTVAALGDAAEAADTAVAETLRVTDLTAGFYDNGVRVGDSVTTDATTWFGSGVGTVTRVISNSAILVEGDTALKTAINSGGTSPVYITRKMTENEIVADLANVPKGIASKRVVLLAGDEVSVPAVTSERISAAYLACAVGGMIAGLPPHSGITNLSIAGIANIYGTHDTFEEANLSVLSDAGWCVFVEDSPAAAPYCLHGVTTDPSALEFSEIMSVKNFDYVASTLAAALKQFLGTWNINAETIGFVGGTLNGVLKALAARTVPRLGAPLISGVLDSVAQHPDSKDRLEIYATLQMPMSLNTIGLHLVSA